MSTDHRDQNRKAFDALVGTSQRDIDLFNEGFEFFENSWPVGGENPPVREVMANSPYSAIDLSHDAECFWQGYERASALREAMGLPIQPMTADDVGWALNEVVRFLKGDRK